ncbi:DEAD/DEAH box helicase [Halobacteriovorax marinus]|uniref:DEAD-box ATP-dependent RNA helicase RhpA n=1 Tax=Halobacteriovorax marinus TaxID=97084 RepID=A0A1Y5FCH0_9BACT|nr:DEAD/DEAH box helicase [Halobacteriovorax marinus]
MSDFKDLNLSPELLKTLTKKGYKTPTEIQNLAIPIILTKRDLLGIAQTGTGKTAAFSLPIIDNIKRSDIKLFSKRARVLIMTPTRELAIQVLDHIQLYAEGLNLKSTAIYGGVGPLNQVRKLSTGVDILVATPGRLVDFLERGHVRLDQLEVFVLDEADRMLDMGFITDVTKVIDQLPEVRQSLFFSATMPEDISKLADTILTDPKRIEVAPSATPIEKIDQVVKHLHRTNKPLLLIEILKEENTQSVLVFTKTKLGADRVYKHLDDAGISCASIHSDRTQGAREKSLTNFRKGVIKVLVATDIAARGIDVERVSHVINYDVPIEAETYVHRIGRTARAGRAGYAITFCDPVEIKYLKAIEKLLGCEIKEDQTHTYFGAPPRVYQDEPKQKLTNPNKGKSNQPKRRKKKKK